MKKFIDRMLRFFYTTKVGEYYIYILLWYDNLKFRKEVKNRSNAYAAKIVANATQMAYEEGIRVVRTKVKRALKSYDEEEFDKTLKSFGEGLINLADGTKNSGDVIRAEILWKAYVKPSTKDVVSESDRAKMVQERISDYIELRNHKLKRDLLRKIRKAWSDGNEALAQELQREFNERFSRSKTGYRKS